MKTKSLFKSIIRLIIFVSICLLIFFVENPTVVQAEELYFDEEGNLYFHTRDRKATGSVGYATIGWIIKRYDMPMNAPGQQYVIVTKMNYKPDETDPEDSNYLLCYFKTDKDEILNAVQSVSQEWYDILTKYGDDVYIDSVMTVGEDGVLLGTLYEGGAYEGEVYFTYETMSVARWWSSLDCIKEHYDMVVRFLQTEKPKETEVVVTGNTRVDIGNAVGTSFIVGAGAYGSEHYDIKQGIPSGEQLYVKGVVDSTVNVLKLSKVTGQVTLSVPVPVTYLLKWTDYYGNQKEETRLINRYYEVTRDFSYYAYGGIDTYTLQQAVIKSEVLKDVYSVDIPSIDNSSIINGTVIYGNADEHIVKYEVSAIPNMGTVVLTGTGGKKPSIPDVDYSDIAENAVGHVSVKNDKVMINGVVVVSDEISAINGIKPSAVIPSQSCALYKDKMDIDKSMANGSYDKTAVTLTYINSDGIKKVYESAKFGNVVIHTPVYCNGTSAGAKEMNQAITPLAKDVVLGETLALSFNDFGKHRDIRGYGLRSYAPYVGNRQVCCPFDVVYKGVRYGKNEWITIDGYTDKVIVCEDNKEGLYTVCMRTLAYNSGEDVYDENMGVNANIDINTYGALDYEEVRLIGKIHNLKLAYGEVDYGVKDMPVEVGLDADASYALSFDTVGDMFGSDYVKIEYTYYHENKDGVLTPVDVYGVRDRNYINGVVTGKFVDSKLLMTDTCVKNGNVATWSTDHELYGEVLVVPKGTESSYIQEMLEKDRANEILLDGGFIIVCVDIISYKEDKPYLSYTNEINASKGFCNMWLREGGSESYPYGAVVKIPLGDITYYDYEISGTH